jgi:hypothetical protein
LGVIKVIPWFFFVIPGFIVYIRLYFTGFIITEDSILKNSLNPKNTKEYFKSKNWKTIAGFQTRNPIHKAHLTMQRVGLKWHLHRIIDSIRL